MSTQEIQFYMMICLAVIALSFLVIAIMVIILVYMSRKAINTIDRLDEMLQPLLTRTNRIGLQGEEILVQLTKVTEHFATAGKHFSDSASLIKDEIGDLKELTGMTVIEAKEKVALVSKTIEQTQMEVVDTTAFIQSKVVEPAREVAAIMAGVKKGLEVLFAPSPKQIDRAYHEDEMFIG